MASLTAKDVKIGLSHFFVSVEKYKADKKSSEQTSYFINKNTKYSLIVVSLVDFDDNEIKAITDKLKSAKHEAVPVLKIALFNTLKTDDNIVVISEPIFYKDELKDLFPKIHNFSIESQGNDDSDENLSEEELLEMLNNPEKAKDKDLRELTAKIRSGFTPIAATITALFFGLPIIAFGLSFYFTSKGSSYLSNGSVSSLFFGGSDRNLTILAGQVWRIFTYGFNMGPSSVFIGLIETFIIGMLILTTAKYSEAAVGPLKLLTAVFGAYALSGLFATALPSAIAGGPYVILAALIGVLGFSTTKKSSPVSVISRSKLFLPLIVLFIIPFFDGNYTNYLMLILGIAVSGSIMFLWNYNYKKVSYDIIAPSVILGVVLVLPIVLAFAYAPVPAYSGYDIYTIQSYIERGWIKTIDHGTNVLHKIGWNSYSFNYAFDKDGNQYIQLFTDGEGRY